MEMSDVKIGESYRRKWSPDFGYVKVTGKTKGRHGKHLIHGNLSVHKEQDEYLERNFSPKELKNIT